jgi:hypothetical protein
MATGGTDYGAGIRALSKYKPGDGEDALFLFVGDEGDQRGEFVNAVNSSGLDPVAFALVKLESADSHHMAVTRTASTLGIPLFRVTRETFDDVYNVPRTVAALVAATPVGVVPGRVAVRKTLVETILECPLLVKPQWAE